MLCNLLIFLRTKANLLDEQWQQFEARLGVESEVGETTLNIMRQTHLSQIAQIEQRIRYMSLLGRSMELAGRFSLPLDVALGILDTGAVLQAALPQDRERVLYREIGKVSGEVMGGIFGVGLGSAIGGFAGGVGVGSLLAAAGGAIGENVMDYAYRYHDIIDPAVKISAPSLFPLPMQSVVDRELQMFDRLIP